MKVRLSLLGIVLMFGASLPAYKLASRSFGPATTNLIRFTVSAALMALLARRHLRSLDRKSFVRLLLIGAGGLGFMAFVMGVGVDEGSASVSSVIVGLEPIGVAIAGMLFVGDRPQVRSLLALVIGFLGALVASGLLTEPAGSVPLLPVVLLCGTVISFSVYTAMVRRVRGSIEPLAISAVTQIGALVFVLPATLFDVVNNDVVRRPIRWEAVFAAVVMLGVGSAIAYLLLCTVLASQPASRVAVSMYLTPVIGVLLSWLLVNERLFVRTAMGGLLVLLAVWISEGGMAMFRSQPVDTSAGGSA
jgi:drug/metabolite transporter (DMT)-like permease